MFCAILLFIFCQFDPFASQKIAPLTGDDIRQSSRTKKNSEFLVPENATEEGSNRWPNAEVPYLIAFGTGELPMGFSEPFHSAIDSIQRHTCVRFRQRLPTDSNFVTVIDGEGCWSYVGAQRGLDAEGQPLSLAPECWRKGVILHELMHLLGFYHEHSRWDRDRYIRLNVSNIEKERIHQFNRRRRDAVDELSDYDFGSIMHYEPNAFAIDPESPTILPIVHKEDLHRMGQRIRLSAGDIAKINRLYNCPEHKRHRDGGGASDKARHRVAKELLLVSPDGQQKIPTNWAHSFYGTGPFEALTARPPTTTTQTAKAKDHVDGAGDHVVPFQNEQDFFLRTGLAPTGSSTMAFQLFDGMITAQSMIPLAVESIIPSAGVQREQTANSTDGTTIVCPRPEQASCVDRMHDCVQMARSGECEKKPGLMLRMCRRSCCNCDDAKCFDTNDEAKYGTLCMAQNRQSNAVVLSACDMPETRQNALDYCPKMCGTCVPIKDQIVRDK